MNKSGFNFRKIIIETESNSNDEKVSAFVSIDKYIKDRSSRPDFQFNNSLDNSLNDSKSKNQFFEDNDISTVNIEEIEAFVSEINLLIDEEISEESVVIHEENSIDQLLSNEEDKLTSIIEVTSIDEILVEDEKTFFSEEVLIDEFLEAEEQVVESEEVLIDELSEEEEEVVESEEVLIDDILEEEERLVVNEEVSIDDILQEEEQVSVSEIASIDDLLEDESVVVSEEVIIEEFLGEDEPSIVSEKDTTEEVLEQDEPIFVIDEVTIEEVLEEETVLVSETVSIDEILEVAEEHVESKELPVDEILNEETQVVESKQVSIDEFKEEDPIIASEIASIDENLEDGEPVIVSEEVIIENELEINNFYNDIELKKSEPEVDSDEVESLNKQDFDIGDFIQKEDFLSFFEVGNTIIFPRLGAFTITNEKTGELFFIPYLKHDDNVLNDYISKREGISIEDAKKQISSYVDSIKYNLDNYNQFIFNDFGRLFYDKNKELTFDKNDSKDSLIDTYENLNNAYQDTNIKVEVNEIDSQIVVDDIELITENFSINISENIPENTIENTIHPTEDVVENISELSTENSSEKYIVEPQTETISNNKVNEIIEEVDAVSESTNYVDLETSIFNHLNLENNEQEIFKTEIQDSFNQKNTSKSKSKKGILISLVSLSLILVVLSIFFVFRTKKNEVSVEKRPEIVSKKQENKSYDKKSEIKEVKNEESVFSEVKEKKQSVENISATQNIPKNENNINNTSKVNGKVTVTQQTNLVKTKNTVLAPVVKKNPIGLNNNIQPKSSLNTKKENVSLPTTNKLNTKNINFDSLKVSPTVRNMIESGYYDVFIEDKQIILKTKSR